jgi:hypothetical protein
VSATFLTENRIAGDICKFAKQNNIYTHKNNGQQIYLELSLLKETFMGKEHDQITADHKDFYRKSANVFCLHSSIKH